MYTTSKSQARNRKKTPISLRERVYRYLTKAILEGKLQYGELLDQDNICKELSVSKAPLRDALIRLEAEGFITILPRKGVYITPVSRSFIRSAYQIIGSIEADCIDEVFHKITKKHISQLETSNERQHKYLQKNNFTAYYDENIIFHNIFLSLSQNTLLHKTLDPLRQRLYDFPRRAHAIEWEEFHLLHHQRFIDSIKIGNKKAAISIFRYEHWGFDLHEPYMNLYYKFDEDNHFF